MGILSTRSRKIASHTDASTTAPSLCNRDPRPRRPGPYTNLIFEPLGWANLPAAELPTTHREKVKEIP